MLMPAAASREFKNIVKMEEILNKQIAQKAMEIEGEARGVSFKGEMEYILETQGREAITKIEEELARVGYPIKYDEIKEMQFYPIGWEVTILLAVKKLFNLSDQEFRKMGEFESKLSLVIRVFMKHLFSIDLAVKEAPNVWKKNYTIGDLKVIELDKEKGQGTIRLEDFKVNPIICRVLEGFFANVVKMVIGKPTTCQETKCQFRGDECHEFVIRW